ncbi:MAG: DUF2299 family protein [Candidatus Scalindua sp.]|nr:DUF2299 family protein [Candidatus Scalindua sp.]
MLEQIKEIRDVWSIIKNMPPTLCIVISILIGVVIGVYIGYYLFYQPNLVSKENIIDGKNTIIQTKDTIIQSKDNKILDLKVELSSCKKKLAQSKKLDNNDFDKEKKTYLTPLEIENEVQDWLINEGYVVQKVQSKNTEFRFIITNTIGDEIMDKIVVELPKSKELYLMFKVKLSLSSEHQEAISKLSLVKRNELLVSIKNALTNIGLGFEVPSPEKIEFDQILYIEDLNRSNFFKILNSLKRARVMISTFFHTAIIINP